jgi:hypothetical protein
VPEPAWDLWSELAAAEVLGYRSHGGSFVCVAARNAADTLMSSLASDAPRPVVEPAESGSVSLGWFVESVAAAWLKFGADGSLVDIQWSARGPVPSWMCGLLVLAAQSVRCTKEERNAVPPGAA